MRLESAGVALSAALVGSVCLGPAGADAQPRDMYGLGLDLAAMCDLTPGAAIGERCYGFLGAIVEMALGSQQLREQGYDEASLLFVRTCIPLDLRMEQIVEAIRSHISPECTAVCSESSYVLAALAEAYPCPEDLPAEQPSAD